MKKRIALLLILCMVFVALVSCGETKENDRTTETDRTVESESDRTPIGESETERISRFDQLPAADYGDTDFVILTKQITGSNMWDPVDIYAVEETGDLINDAIFFRNAAVEEKYKVQIVQRDDNGYETLVANAISGGSHEFDVVDVNLMTTLGGFALKGYLEDMKSFDIIDLNQEYWDGSVNESIEILGRQYAAISQITFIDDCATWCLLFNKERAANVQIDPSELYSLAKNGKWTIEKLYDYAAMGVHDEAGDGMDSRDYWGIYTQYEAVNPLMASTGLRAVVRKDDGTFVSNLDSNDMYETMEALYDYMSDKSVQLYAEDSGFSDIWNGVKEQFASGFGLFFISPVGNINLTYLREMEQPFGILPLPKFNEEDPYTTTMQYNNATAVAILSCGEDTEKTALLLEAMAAASPSTVTEAFYDKVLSRKRVKDEESSEMLDLIFKNKTVDTALLYNWAGVGGMFQRIMKANSFTYASEVASIRENLDQAIADTLEAFS